MALKLMYITADSAVAKIAQDNGVDRIFIDMEYIGKADRQGGMNTVQNHHTIEDICRIRPIVDQSQLLVRINPIHEAGNYMGLPHTSSQEEIDAAIEAGADILMLPFFKTVDEVRSFIEVVAGRVTTSLLLETPEAVEVLDDILKIPGIDEIHVGINDLNLGYGGKFMFELVSNGTVEKICQKVAETDISYGFGGIAAVGQGMLPAEHIICEHHRMGSTCAILSRAFCNTSLVTDLDEIQKIFSQGMKDIRELEEECEKHDKNSDYYLENKKVLAEKVALICANR